MARIDQGGMSKSVRTTSIVDTIKACFLGQQTRPA
jgi:hypothetical protein